MNEEKSQEKFEDALKEPFEADFEQNCQGRTGPDLSFMKEQAREKPKKKYRVSFGKVAAVVVIVLLGTNAVLLLSNNSQSYGDKGILHRLYQGIAGIVTDSDEEVNPEDEVESLTITSMKDMDKAKRFLPELYVPEYIPQGYQLNNLTIDKYAGGDYVGTYEFTDEEGSVLGICPMAIAGDSSYATSGKGEMIELADRKILVAYDDVEQCYTAAVYTESCLMDISGKLDKDEIIRVAKGLKQ